MPHTGRQPLPPNRNTALLGLLLLAAGSAALAGDEPTVAQDRLPPAPAVATPPTDAPSHDFHYRETIDNPDTRSAGRRGILTHKGRTLAGFPGRLVTPIGTFAHHESPLLWRPQGWFPTESPALIHSARPFDASARQSGRYTGPRRSGTPPDWVYLPEQDTWLDPAQLATRSIPQ